MVFYEGIFIMPQSFVREDKQRAFDILNDLIRKFEGTVDYIDIWSERKMTYPIKHVRDAAYILTYFKAPGDAVRKIERAITLEDSILRCMIIRPDKSFDLEKFKSGQLEELLIKIPPTLKDELEIPVVEEIEV